MLHIIQTHYPERLGLALIINVPFLINAFFNVIMPFVDPVTRNKVKFNPKIYEDGIMTKDQVMKEWWDGDQEFEWDHDKYWPALIKICDERRHSQMERWRQLGAKVGLSEWDFKSTNTEGSSNLPEANEKIVHEVPKVTVEPAVA